MDDDIAAKVSNLKITEEEDQLIALNDIPEDQNHQDLSLALVGKVLTGRSYNVEALKRTLNQIWVISKRALLRSIENDFFVVQFACKRDKEKVLAGRPWSFDQNLVMLQEIEEDVQPSNIVI